MKNIKIISIALILSLCAGLGFAKEKYISPNNDGVQDELVIPLNISDKSDIILFTGFFRDDNLPSLAHFHYSENEFSVMCFHND